MAESESGNGAGTAHPLPTRRSDSPSPPSVDPPTPESSSDEEVDDTSPYWTDMITTANNELGPSILEPRDAGTPDNWIHSNRSLVHITANNHPFNAEPPLTRLMRTGFITPVPLHYVRNHGAVPRATWEDWTIEVSGLVDQPRIYKMDDLLRHFETREFPVTLVCAANRRTTVSHIAAGAAASISTSVWAGVALSDVLEHCKINSLRNLIVYFEGADDIPGAGKYGTRLKVEYAKDEGRKIILAYMQNGERLSPDHGFPVRLIIPGFVAGKMVKWLIKIVVKAQESNSHHLGVPAESPWCHIPDMVNELNINSVITTPCHEEVLDMPSSITDEWPPYTLRGYAYSGGGRKVDRVEISLDCGENWKVCEVLHPERPRKYNKYWCWCFWSLDVETRLFVGATEIVVRAFDESRNTQPEELVRNHVMGMMNNCWFRVRIHVSKLQENSSSITFNHPTNPEATTRLNQYNWQVKRATYNATD